MVPNHFPSDDVVLLFSQEPKAFLYFALGNIFHPPRLNSDTTICDYAPWYFLPTSDGGFKATLRPSLSTIFLASFISSSMKKHFILLAADIKEAGAIYTILCLFLSYCCCCWCCCHYCCCGGGCCCVLLSTPEVLTLLRNEIVFVPGTS